MFIIRLITWYKIITKLHKRMKILNLNSKPSTNVQRIKKNVAKMTEAAC